MTRELVERNFEQAELILKELAAEANLSLQRLAQLSPGQLGLRYFFIGRDGVTVSLVHAGILHEDSPELFRARIVSEFKDAQARFDKLEVQNGEAQGHGQATPRT